VIGKLLTFLKIQEVIVITYSNIYIDLPGPGNYRLPSEFGHYESKNKFSSSMMQRTFSQPALNETKKDQL